MSLQSVNLLLVFSVFLLHPLGNSIHSLGSSIIQHLGDLTAPLPESLGSKQGGEGSGGASSALPEGRSGEEADFSSSDRSHKGNSAIDFSPIHAKLRTQPSIKREGGGLAQFLSHRRCPVNVDPPPKCSMRTGISTPLLLHTSTFQCLEQHQASVGTQPEKKVCFDESSSHLQTSERSLGSSCGAMLEEMSKEAGECQERPSPTLLVEEAATSPPRVIPYLRAWAWDLPGKVSSSQALRVI
ncbi:uncharacterized protein [Equus przewalskii]|uniref:Uncharacterized protein n=1 Tax=Equus przewalskii TaxID=9798 RepID=A0ABM4NEL7_EQUPR